MQLALAFLVAAQSAFSVRAINLRTEQHVWFNATIMSQMSHFNWNNAVPKGMWNHGLTGLVQHEVELTKTNPPTVNKIAYVILAMMFGCCGCDRCYMGQICLGTIKGLTFGGFFIWQIIDYVVCLINALSKSKDINMMGFHANFEPDTIGTAFWLALFLFVINVLNTFQSAQQARAQQEQQARIMEAAVAQDRPQPQITRRDSGLAFMPTMLTRNLRGAGLVSAKPSVPEIIAAFQKIDKNGDGQLDHDELRQALQDMGATDDLVDELIKSADTDNDGKISMEEFILNMTQDKKT